MDVETLAKILHEAGREAVMKKATVNPNIHPKFLEWDELEEHMKEGRRIQARYLWNYFKANGLIKLTDPYSKLIERFEKVIIAFSEDDKDLSIHDVTDIDLLCQTVISLKKVRDFGCGGLVSGFIDPFS